MKIDLEHRLENNVHMDNSKNILKNLFLAENKFMIHSMQAVVHSRRSDTGRFWKAPKLVTKRPEGAMYIKR